MPLSFNPQDTKVVLVGISEYPKDIENLHKLPSVRNNINTLRRILSEQGIVGIPSENIETLIDSRAVADVAIKIKEAAKVAHDTLIVYYAGHGLIGGEDNNLYLAVGTTIVEYLTISALPFREVRNAFQESIAKRKILILDCCYAARASKGIACGRDQQNLEAIKKRIEEEKLIEIEGTYELYAAPENKKAQAPLGEKYTAFTALLIEALEKGLKEKGETITLSDIYEHLKQEVLNRKVYTLTHQSLEKLTNENIPVEVLEKLRSLKNYGVVLKNQEDTKKNKFWNAIEKQLGEEQIELYRESILKHVEREQLPVPVQLDYKDAASILFAYNKAHRDPSGNSKQLSVSQIPLSYKIFHHGLWGEIEQIAIRAVTDAGITAMGFYREAWHVSRILEQHKRNPATEADLQSSVTILQTIDQLLSPLTKKERLGCELFYLGEETKFKEELEEQLQPEIRQRILPKEEFFKSDRNSIRVIFDAIDGTANFLRGLPFFSSAVAILIENHLRFAAIYDPMHHIVYSGALKGGDIDPCKECSASVWYVAAGHRVDLSSTNDEQKTDKSFSEKAIGIHLTRDKKYIPELQDFINTSRNFKITEATLEHLKIDEVIRDNDDIHNALKSIIGIEYKNHREIITAIRNTVKNPIGEEQLETITSKILKHTGISEQSKLEQLAKEFGGIYALNSGIMAMVEVARGGLGGFVNSSTNTWDVAAGEVLVRACGGKVTDFVGNPITYSSSKRISVVAAKSGIHERLIEILSK